MTQQPGAGLLTAYFLFFLRMRQVASCATTAVQDGRTLSLVKSRVSPARAANTQTNKELRTARIVLWVAFTTDLARLHASNVLWVAIPMRQAWPHAPYVSLDRIQIKLARRDVTNAQRAPLHMSLEDHPKIRAGSVPTDAALALKTALASVASSW
jgi:hypothetical protein